jgi:hypothetical protein
LGLPFLKGVIMKKTISLKECIHGGLYRINSRNLSFGVFNASEQGFVGIRQKFYDEFLDYEYHLDTGPPFGTVAPKEFLEQCPLGDLETSHIIRKKEDGLNYARTNQILFDWLKEKEKQYYKEEEN